MVLIGLGMAGVAQPTNIELAMVCSWAVMVLWIVLRWPPSPVAMGLNIHLALIPLGLMVSDAETLIPFRERLIENVFATVTLAAVIGAAWGFWRFGATWEGWRKSAVVLLSIAAVPWAVVFADSRLLAVGVPAICLGFLVGRRPR